MDEIPHCEPTQAAKEEQMGDPRSSKSSPNFCCHGSGPDGRNLIVCIDGTANQFGSKNTNVIELYSLILKDAEHNQLTWYNSGIGTYARPSWRSFRHWAKVINHKIDLAIAWNFERTILAAYRWLSDNYQRGDRIFLYGFSRGAFQVRVLSAMIAKVGLIHKGNEEQIPFAYELYADPRTDEPSTSVPVSSQDLPRRKVPFLKRLKTLISGKTNSVPKQEGGISMAERFKSTFSHKDVRVHFVGVWDTVSSIGIIRGTRMLPGTVDGMKHVCLFRHALALDERRVKFTPEYAFGGLAVDVTHLNVVDQSNGAEKEEWDVRSGDNDNLNGEISSSLEHLRAADIDSSHAANMLVKAPPHTLEVWFAGTHSDIGGGNALNEAMDRSRPPLRWMMFESGAAGLRTQRFDRPLTAEEQIEVKESLSTIWWILELLPLPRLTYSRRKNGKQTTFKPHLGSSRKIHEGQKIHGSLLLTNQRYTPKALPPIDKPDLWLDAQAGKGLGEWRAIDLYESTQALINTFVDSRQGDIGVWETLRQTASSGDGRQAVYEGVIMELNRAISTAVKYQLIAHATRTLSNIDRKLPPLKLVCLHDIRGLLTELWKSDNAEWRKTAQEFIKQFVQPTRPSIEMRGHTLTVICISISPDGKQIVSGSSDRTLRVWDSKTGTQIGEPLQGHTSDVRSVAISPNGRFIASGSDDETVRIWDVATGTPVGKPFEGHTGAVYSLAFSIDGKHVASGSRDGTVRIWDLQAGECVDGPLRGHTGRVESVSFSPDGKYLASGSLDRTIRIWDSESRQPVGDPISASGHWAMCVAFSPDSTRIASGSFGGTFRIWDVQTRELVGHLFQGHQSLVWSVAFSHDGGRIVSGSADSKALVWDVDTREIEHTLRHDGGVLSAIFSPDGMSVVSGCNDGVVRVWGVEPW